LANPATESLLMRIHTIIRVATLLFISFLYLSPVRAELSQKQARRLIAKAGGMSLPSSAIHIARVTSSSDSSAEVAAELQLVFRLSRDEAGQWRLKELRTADAQWEDVDLIAQAAKIDAQPNNCNDDFGRVRSQSNLSAKRARCLVANLFNVSLPSDAVRIKELSGLGLGSQPSAIAVSLIQVDFRFTKDSRGWRVSEFHSGNRPWVSLESFPGGIDSLKRTKTADEMNAIVAALEVFRRTRGSYVASDKHAVLMDNLTPHYLHRVIRIDSWQRPYIYRGERDHFTLRSLGPDGKENTPDDLVISR
jgi:hypothetical protein